MAEDTICLEGIEPDNPRRSFCLIIFKHYWRGCTLKTSREGALRAHLPHCTFQKHRELTVRASFWSNPQGGNSSSCFPLARTCTRIYQGKTYPQVLLRLTSASHNLKEEFVGFLFYEASIKTLAVKFWTMITEKWELNMECCYDQA